MRRPLQKCMPQMRRCAAYMCSGLQWGVAPRMMGVQQCCSAACRPGHFAVVALENTGLGQSLTHRMWPDVQVEGIFSCLMLCVDGIMGQAKHLNQFELGL